MNMIDNCDVISLGIVVLDMIANPADKSVFDCDNTEMESIVLSTGGDAANQAVMLAKLGRSVSLSCRVGDDTLGSYFISEMHAQGVDTSRIAVSPDSITGISIVLVAADGQRCFLCKRGNNRDFCIEDIDLSRIANTRVLSIASLFALTKLEKKGMLEVLMAAQNGGVLTFADTMIRSADPKIEDISAFLPYIDYFLPSEAECELLTGYTGQKAADKLIEAGARNVIIKMGDKGVFAHCRDFFGYVPAFSIKAKDTTGSGDAFCAGFIHSKLSGIATQEALVYACACGAFNALHVGPVSPVSDDAIRTFIRTYARQAGAF